MNTAFSWRTIMYVSCTSIATLMLGIFLGYILFTNSIMLTGFFLVIAYFAIKSIRVAFFLFILSIPFNTFVTIQGIIPLKLTHIFFFLLVSAFIHLYKKEEDFIKKIRTPLDSFLFIAILVIIFSVFQSRFIPDNPYIIQNAWRNYPWIKSIIKILVLLFCISVFYLCNFLLDSKEKIKEIILVYISAAVIASLIGLGAYILYVFFGYPIKINGHGLVVAIAGDLPRLVGTEQEPLFFGLYLLTILPILYAMLFSQYLAKEKCMLYKGRWLFLAVILMTITILLTTSRSTLLGLFTSVVILIFLYKEKRSCEEYCKILYNVGKKAYNKFYCMFTSSKKRKKITLTCVVVLLIYGMININATVEKIDFFVEKGIIAPIAGAFNEKYSIGKYWSTKSRLIMYKYALDAWKLHPWFGIGYENYNFYSGQRYYYGLYDFNLNWPEVNNFPLKVLTELGIIGFILFITLVLYFFYYSFQALEKVEDVFWKTVIRGYIAVWSGIGVVLLFSSSITRFYIWVSLGIFMAIIKGGVE